MLLGRPLRMGLRSGRAFPAYRSHGQSTLVVTLTEGLTALDPSSLGAQAGAAVTETVVALGAQNASATSNTLTASIAEQITALDVKSVAMASTAARVELAALTSPTDAASSAGFAWVISDGATLNMAPGVTTLLGTGIGSRTYYASPDLLPGQTLSVTSGSLYLVNDSSMPAVSTGVPVGDPGARDVVIEVLDSPLAWARLIRGGTFSGGSVSGGSIIASYGFGFSDPIWLGIRRDSRDGDIFEISPGAVTPDYTQNSGIPPTYLEGAMLFVPTSITLKGFDGRGRWRLGPASATPDQANGLSGIVIPSPSDIAGTGWDYTPTTPGRRKTIWIQDVECDNYGTSGGDSFIRIRNSGEATSDLNTLHVSVTVKNFKVGKRAPYSGASCFGGGAETILLEDGHVYDGGDGSGSEHNLYLSAKNMTLRGVRTSRSRGYTDSVPSDTSARFLEGHLAKLSAQTGVIEGCCFDGVWLADHSLMLQMKGGGNWTIRGNLFVDSVYPNNSNGAITMAREWSSQYGIFNFFPWIGDLGNSIIFERNVCVHHYPRPILWFFDQTDFQTMRPATGGSYTVNERLASMTVRDNIAMVTSVAAPYMLSGFPGSGNSMYVNNDPNAGANWGTRGNSVLPYSTTEVGFDYRTLKVYTRSGSPVAANGGALSTQRFVWPHGFAARSDSFQGLG